MSGNSGGSSGAATGEALAAVTPSVDCDGSLEIDFNTIAFVLTAFVGMVQYFVQVRIRRSDALQEQARSIAAAHAARVRTQMGEFTMKAMLLGNRIRCTQYIIFRDLFPTMWDATGMVMRAVGETNVEIPSYNAEMKTGYIFRNPYFKYPEDALREIAQDSAALKQYVARHRKLAGLYLGTSQ
eukprot:COSAG02_NODE_607_length_19608_cov_33.568968_5_plen_183_part_00